MATRKIAIIGAGMMGSALCWPLSDNGHQVNLVGTHLDEQIISSIRSNRLHPKLQRSMPNKVIPYSHTQLAEALQDAEIIVSGVSSFGVNWFADTVGPLFKPGIPVLAVTKGLEDLPNGDLLILPEVINRKLPAHLQNKISLNAIGGPCNAHDLAARCQSGVVYCGKDIATLQMLRQTFATSYYHIRISNDMVGVEACAALKNAYALGVGLGIGMMEQSGPDGLSQGYNPTAALFAQGCLEIQRFLRLMEGKPDHISDLPAPGDLYVTAAGGRTVRLGKLLGQGVSYTEARKRLAGETLESVEIITHAARALPKLAARGLARVEDFPLIMHMNRVINEGLPVNIPWTEMFADHIY